jgi:hypothetical protein
MYKLIRVKGMMLIVYVAGASVPWYGRDHEEVPPVTPHQSHDPSPPVAQSNVGATGPTGPAMTTGVATPPRGDRT